MLYYPDQFFYEPYQRSSAQSRARAAHAQGARPRVHAERSFFPQEFTQETTPQSSYYIPSNFGGRPLFASGEDVEEPRPAVNRRSHPARSGSDRRSPLSSWPFAGSNEYFIIQDEDELEALQAYREKKNREAELMQRRREALLRQKEAERIARERAEQVAREQRIRATAEQNARAAARAYIRRKQAEQAAQLQAEYEQKKHSQQIALEKLLYPWFIRSFPDEVQLEHPEQHDKSAEHSENVPSEQSQTEGQSEGQTQGTDEQNTEPSERSQDEAKQYIQLLVDSLAPTLIKVFDPSESSEEEVEQEQEVDEEGPHCETASEDASDASLSELDTQAQPPHVGADMSEEDPAGEEPITEEPITDNPTIREQSEDPVVVLPFTELGSKQEKRQKSNVNNTQPKKTRRRFAESSVADATPEKIIRQLKEWKLKLQSIKEGEKAFSSYPEDPVVVSALKKRARSLVGKTEDIYNNLDGLRVGKDCRKLKHDLTSEAVALAEKLELALLRLNATGDTPSTPKYHVTLEDVPDEDSN